MEEKQIVPTNQNYFYVTLEKNIQELKQAYPFLEIGTIGKSVLGKEIFYIKIGKGKREVLYHASIHANEWITSVLLMKYVEEFCKAYKENETIKNESAQILFMQASLYIVPMVNPDGVDLVTRSINPNTSIYQNYLAIAQNYPDISFPDGWKANFNGVDLNLQFPALWQNAKQIKYAQGFNKPAPRDFVGEGPLTELEALNLYNFTLKHNFDLTISYHTQGKEIYYQFLEETPPEAKQIGEIFAKLSGYHLTQVAYASSFAGYKDWFIQKYHKPSFTIEARIWTKSITHITI